MKPKIVVLDGYLMNPSDFSWDEISSLGNSAIYERTSENLVIERCEDAEIVITNKVKFPKEVIERLPKLKYIGVTATGYDNVDIRAAAQKGVIVTNVPAYSTSFVVQHTLALLLELTNQVGLHNQAVRSGEWQTAADFCFWKTPLIELDHLTLGVVGYGSIGRAFAKVISFLGMKILVHSRSQKDPNAEYVDLKTLLEKSDVISLHAPYSKETHHMINEQSLSLMKPTAILINTSRGQLIDEKALAKALKEKRIFAAALDVLEQEPPSSKCPLIGIDNCIITPHIAWASIGSRKRLFSIVIDNIKAFLAGDPKNVI